jgi:ParB-like chromosome segregation protein Spo0J
MTKDPMDTMVQQMNAKSDAIADEYYLMNKPAYDAIAKLREFVANGEFKSHPQADMFPLIEGKEREELLQSIRANGITQKIAIDKKGLVVDGRNRMSCFIELRAMGEEVRSPNIELIADKDVTAYIMAANIHRRHLTKQQRAAIIALTTEKMSKAESIKLARATKLKKPVDSEKSESEKSDAERAKEAGVSQDLITEARKQPTEVLEAIIKGEAKLPTKAKAPATRKPKLDKVLAEAIKQHSDKLALFKEVWAALSTAERIEVCEITLDWHASDPDENN